MYPWSFVTQPVGVPSVQVTDRLASEYPPWTSPVPTSVTLPICPPPVALRSTFPNTPPRPQWTQSMVPREVRLYPEAAVALLPERVPEPPPPPPLGKSWDWGTVCFDVDGLDQRSLACAPPPFS